MFGINLDIRVLENIKQFNFFVRSVFHTKRDLTNNLSSLFALIYNTSFESAVETLVVSCYPSLTKNNTFLFFY